AGETVSLLRPGAPAGPITPYITVDRLTYSATDGWPPTPNGTGPSLVRLDPLAYGNDVVNWTASSAPTPGRPNALTTATGQLALDRLDRITVKFTEDVSADLDSGDLTLQNLSGGAIPTMMFSWDLATLTATWQFNQPLVDG